MMTLFFHIQEASVNLLMHRNIERRGKATGIDSTLLRWLKLPKLDQKSALSWNKKTIAIKRASGGPDSKHVVLPNGLVVTGWVAAFVYDTLAAADPMIDLLEYATRNCSSFATTMKC